MLGTMLPEVFVNTALAIFPLRFCPSLPFSFLLIFPVQPLRGLGETSSLSDQPLDHWHLNFVWCGVVSKSCCTLVRKWLLGSWAGLWVHCHSIIKYFLFSLYMCVLLLSWSICVMSWSLIWLFVIGITFNSISQVEVLVSVLFVKINMLSSLCMTGMRVLRCVHCHLSCRTQGTNKRYCIANITLCISIPPQHT